jgi:hypothetical protein
MKPVRILMVALGTLLTASGSPAAAPTSWPPPADGDLLHLAYARLPRPGGLYLRYGYEQRGDRSNLLTTSRVLALYGLSPRLAIGVALPYHEQRIGDLTKRGPGDASFQLRWLGWQSEDHPLFGTLRVSLSLPTGYDQELPPLDSFTSRTHDVLAEGILQWHGENLDLLVAPGFWMPGGEKSAAVTGGLALDWHRGLPLGFRLRGEYFSRYDLVDRTYASEVFGGLRHPLPWGFGLEVGAHRELLSGASAQTTWMARLSLGSPQEVERPPRWVAHPTAVTLWIEDPGCLPGTADPDGFRFLLKGELLNRVASIPGVLLASSPQEEVTLSVETEIVHCREGNARGFSIPHILATPQATLEITLRLRIRGGRDGAVLDETLLHRRLRRGTGMEVLPVGSDEDRWVPPPEVRRALREEAARRLARDAEARIRDVLEGLVTP